MKPQIVLKFYNELNPVFLWYLAKYGRIPVTDSSKTLKLQLITI